MARSITINPAKLDTVRAAYAEAPLRVLVYWMQEREQIRLNRAAGKPWPWTKDPILQEYKFTNVFREFDRVTLHFMDWVEPPFFGPKGKVIGTIQPGIYWFNSIMYRIINWPDTMDDIGRIDNWPKQRRHFIRTMERRKLDRKQIYTGAYMITAEMTVGLDKYVSTARTLDQAWKLCMGRTQWAGVTPTTVMEIVKETSILPRVGQFIGYEVACDLTYLYPDLAPSGELWANPGPGAVRGLNRVWKRPLKSPIKEDAAIREMIQLHLMITQSGWPHERPLNLRAIEHSLCEFDKYSRVLLGEGRPRSKYTPPRNFNG